MPSLAGSFLVAKPELQDSNFRQAVVLLLQHGDEGAFGLVVNRPVKAEGLPFPVFQGGPCQAPGLMLLHGHAEWQQSIPHPSPKGVAPGIFLGDASCLKQITDPDPGQEYRCRVYSGYAGWSAGQLEGELSVGAWWVVAASGEVLFATPSEELWDRLVPPKIPQFSLN